MTHWITLAFSPTTAHWLQLLVPLGVAGVAVAIAFRPSSDERVARWAEARGLVLTDESRGLIRRYLNRTRRLRFLGLAVGFLTVLVSGALFNFVASGSRVGRVLLTLAESNALVIAGCGYLAGALLAELSLTRPKDKGRPRASLMPRERRQYVSPGARAALWGLAATLVALIPWPLLARHASTDPAVHRATVGHAAFLALLGVAVALVVEALQEGIVRRPQRYTDRALVEADDALRASSAAACTGVGLAALMNLVGYTLWEISLHETFHPLRLLLALASLVLVLGGLREWVQFGLRHAWVVRRGPQAPSARPRGDGGEPEAERLGRASQPS